MPIKTNLHKGMQMYLYCRFTARQALLSILVPVGACSTSIRRHRLHGYQIKRMHLHPGNAYPNNTLLSMHGPIMHLSFSRQLSSINSRIASPLYLQFGIYACAVRMPVKYAICLFRYAYVLMIDDKDAMMLGGELPDICCRCSVAYRNK